MAGREERRLESNAVSPVRRGADNVLGSPLRDSPPKTIPGTVRTPVSRFSRFLVAGSIALGSLFSPNFSRAEDKKLAQIAKAEGKKVAKAEMSSVSQPKQEKKPLDPELAKLPRISMEEIKKLSEETCKEPRICSSGIIRDSLWVTSVLGIKTPNGMLVAGASIGHDSKSNKDVKELDLYLEGNPIASVDLKPLEVLYKKATGKEKLEYVRLIVAPNDYDNELGSAVTVTAFAVDSPTSDVKCNDVARGASYYIKQKKVLSGNEIAGLAADNCSVKVSQR